MALKYNHGVNQNISFGQALSDKFLGTNNQGINAMNQQNMFSEHMSNTQYQRQVADMKQAGINPMIAYSNGSGNGGFVPQGAPQGNPSNGGLVGGLVGKTINAGLNLVSLAGGAKMASQALKNSGLKEVAGGSMENTISNGIIKSVKTNDDLKSNWEKRKKKIIKDNNETRKHLKILKNM